MNILLTNATGIFAGGEDYVHILARHLNRRGHIVNVSAKKGHLLLAKCQESGIPVIPIEYGNMSRVFAVGKQLRREIRTRSIDIIHSNANYDRTCAALGAAFTNARHIASIHSTHSIQHNLTHWIRNRYGINHFIAVADAVRDLLVTEDGIAPARVTFIPNGVEAQSAAFRSEARKKTRSLWEISPETVVIGNVARLTEFKGHAFLLQSIAQIVREHRNVFFPVFGDGELMESMRAEAQSLNIEKHVRFFGFVDNIQEVYPAFDIYCHSSIDLGAEAFPMAILSAMAAELPVVATRVGGIHMMVDNGKNGFLLEPERPKEFADALLPLITNQDLRTTMGKESYRLFERKFQASIMAERVEEVYERTLSQ